MLLGILRGRVGRLALVTKDRLLRFGSELLFRICDFFRVEVVILDAEPAMSREQQLTEEITWCGCRTASYRTGKMQKLALMQRFGQHLAKPLSLQRSLLPHAALRYVCGVLPVQWRNARWNAVGSSKPTSYAIAVIVSDSDRVSR